MILLGMRSANLGPANPTVNYLVVAGGGGGGAQIAGGYAPGGGGGRGSTIAANGAAGGSGVVVLKIPDTRTATFSGGVTSSLATSGGFKTYTITAAGVSDTVTFS